VFNKLPEMARTLRQVKASGGAAASQASDEQGGIAQ
jgi:hypothetical protein